MVKKRFRMNGIFYYRIKYEQSKRESSPRAVRQPLIHADFDPLAFGCGSMETHFHLIEVNMHHFFAVRADLGDLTVEIDGISATGTTRNDNANDFCFLLHGVRSFQIWANCGKFITLEGLNVSEYSKIIPGNQWFRRIFFQSLKKCARRDPI